MNTKELTRIEIYKNGFLSCSYVEDEYGKMQGLYKAYNRYGIIEEATEYRDDILHGLRKWYDENGKTEEIEIYKNGFCRWSSSYDDIVEEVLTNNDNYFTEDLLNDYLESIKISILEE